MAKIIIELSKEQQVIILRKMYKRALKDPHVNYGMCELLRRVANQDLDWRLGSCFGNRLDMLPTLYKQKPKKVYSPYAMWVPYTEAGWDKRLRWLEKAIKEASTNN